MLGGENTHFACASPIGNVYTENTVVLLPWKNVSNDRSSPAVYDDDDDEFVRPWFCVAFFHDQIC